MEYATGTRYRSPRLAQPDEEIAAVVILIPGADHLLGKRLRFAEIDSAAMLQERKAMAHARQDRLQPCSGRHRLDCRLGEEIDMFQRLNRHDRLIIARILSVAQTLYERHLVQCGRH